MTWKKSSNSKRIHIPYVTVQDNNASHRFYLNNVASQLFRTINNGVLPDRVDLFFDEETYEIFLTKGSEYSLMVRKEGDNLIASMVAAGTTLSELGFINKDRGSLTNRYMRAKIFKLKGKEGISFKLPVKDIEDEVAKRVLEQLGK